MSLYAATSCLLVALAIGAFAEGLYFVDVTTESGIQLKNTSGNKQRYIVEGMMGGAAFLTMTTMVTSTYISRMAHLLMICPMV